MGMEKYRMRMHHVGIVLPTIEAAKEVMDTIGVEVTHQTLSLQNTAPTKAPSNLLSPEAAF